MRQSSELQARQDCQHGVYRVRRRLREIYRLNAHRFKPGYDIVVVARSRSVGAPYQKLEAGFLNACGKLGLLEERL